MRDRCECSIYTYSYKHHITSYDMMRKQDHKDTLKCISIYMYVYIYNRDKGREDIPFNMVLYKVH